MGVESTSPCIWVKHLADLLRNKVNSQQYPSFYEYRRPKSIKDTEKNRHETIKPGTVKRPELDAKRGHPNS